MNSSVMRVRFGLGGTFVPIAVSRPTSGWIAVCLLAVGCTHPPQMASRKNLDVPALLAPPTDVEITQVRQSWRNRRLDPDDVQKVWTGTVAMTHATFGVTVLAHRVHGDRHFGAVFVPESPPQSPLPIVIDVRGVRWDYPSRDLSNGPYSANLVKDLQGRFLFAVPCLRGHVLEINDRRFESEGDRRDSWDGATDDVIAFLSVVLSEVPEADPYRIASFGYSRGAGVALLHRTRDARVDAVVGFATPSDWFSLMGRPGEDWHESIEAALADPELPKDSREHQFIEWFIEDREDLPLAQIRARILASSPLHFAESLPPAQLHHGARDPSVPVSNALEVKARWQRFGVSGEDHECFVYDDAGHDLSGTMAGERARLFIAGMLGG